MKWNQITLDKLRLGDVFKSHELPNRTYQVDSISENYGSLSISSTSFGKEVPDLYFSGTGGPYYRLEMPGMEALDALAKRNAELQERCEQRDARFMELLKKWEDKRLEEQK